MTADLTIALRERRRRWWSLSAPLVPGLGSFQASISSRLPAWGRGVFEASTYYVTFNLMGFANPLVQLLPVAWNARPAAALVLERPPLPGQEWLSGFALSPTLSVRTMLSRYGGAHLARGVRAALREEAGDAMGVPVTAGGRPDAGVLICEKPGPRLRWLRRGAIRAADLAMAAMLP